jgi:DNA polymerase-3 subunit delta'
MLLHDSDRARVASLVASGVQSVLIEADRGYGKRTIAMAIAQEICGSQTGLITVVEPIDASIIIDQIRNLKKFFTLKTHTTTEKRVAVLIDADTMTKEAQNSLLKLLEEPPEHCHLILTSSDSDELLPTIVSRVQTYRLRAIPKEHVITYLVRRGYKSFDIQSALSVTAGLIGATSSIMSGEEDGYVASLKRAKELLGQKHLERLKSIDQLTKDKQSTLLVLDAFKTIAVAGIQAKAKNSDLWKNLLRLSSQAEKQLSHNVSTKLVLTNLFLSI